jgi:hypothetical protein
MKRYKLPPNIILRMSRKNSLKYYYGENVITDPDISNISKINLIDTYKQD